MKAEVPEESLGLPEPGQICPSLDSHPHLGHDYCHRVALSRNSGWSYPDVFLNSKNFSNLLELRAGLDLACELPGLCFPSLY